MKNQVVLFVLVIFLISCQNQVQKDKLRLVFDCAYQSKAKFEFKESDFLKVDWKNQQFYLREGVVNHNEFGIKTCYEGCKLYCYLDKELIYSSVLYCDVAPNPLSQKGENVIYIKAGDPELNILNDNKLTLDHLNKLQFKQGIAKRDSLTKYLYDEKVKKRLLESGLLFNY